MSSRSGSTATRTWDGWDLAALDAAFDVFAGPGQPFIDAARVRQDITGLQAAISRVNAYTTRQSPTATTTPAGYPQGRRLPGPSWTPPLMRWETSARSTAGYVTQEKRLVLSLR